MRKTFYSFSLLLSYNATYNFVVGGRGLGKTYGAKKRAIRRALRKGEQFIYLRRYKTEIPASKQTFFADISHEFPGWEFVIRGNTAKASRLIDEEKFSDEKDYKKALKERKWVDIGFFYALSSAQSLKSVSFPKVTTIMFDEFIIEKGHNQYIQDETTVFNNFYSTVDRWKDKTRVYFMANSVSIMNPYFIEYEIEPDNEGEIVIRKGGFIAAHFPDSEKFKEEIYQTKFGQFIKDTEYAEFAAGNQFADNNDELIHLKDGKAKYMYTLETKTGVFSVWFDAPNNKYFVQEKLPRNQDVYTLLPHKMSADKTLVYKSDKFIGYLRSAFNTARIMFDKPATRNAFADIFKR